jgi:hypothetical protein
MAWTWPLIIALVRAVGQNIGKIGIAAIEHDLDLTVRDLDHVGKLAGRRTRRGSGSLAAMQVQRIKNVLGRQRLAIVEGDALTDLEGPFLGVGRGFPAFEQLGLDHIVLVDFDKAVEGHIGLVDRHPVLQNANIEIVGGGTAADAELEHTAALGRRFLGECGRHDQAAGESCKTEPCCTSDELAAAQVE